MKQKLKMIVSDLDGTLLQTDKTISAYTKSVLTRCRRAGVKVVYATGRGGSSESVAPAKLFDGRITMNGATARIGGRVVYSRLIPCQTARTLLLDCDRRGLKTASERSGMHYANFSVSDKWPGITNFRITDFALHDLDAEKLYAVVRSDDDIRYIESHLPDGLYLTVSRDGLAQVMHRDAAKSKAVAALAEHWDIAQNEIAAFGDDRNDMDLLTYAGTGVAMANAVNEVKAVADDTGLTNDEDGVAVWLEKNLL